jgi:hypothetical protein
MNGFAEALHAAGPHPSLGRHADTYGRLIGSWAGTYHDYPGGQREETGPMEVHFGWVLQGRAVQDTWIAPPRALRTDLVGGVPGGKHLSQLQRQTYGTTVRIFDPKMEVWRSTWLNPVGGYHNELIGRRIGDDIVQICTSQGTAGAGADRPEKWVFSRITARSFLWQALVLEDDGVAWRTTTEFQLHRTA